MPPPRRPGPVCQVADSPFSPGGGSPGFQWTILQRHGRRPLAIMGRVLLSADNRCAGLSCWSQVAIFETAASRFAASLSHTRLASDEAAWKDAWLCDDTDAVQSTLYAHDPLWAFPPPLVPGGRLSDSPAAFDGAAAIRFHAAWAGLLAAVFGMPRPQQRQPMSPRSPDDDE